MKKNTVEQTCRLTWNKRVTTQLKCHIRVAKTRITQHSDKKWVWICYFFEKSSQLPTHQTSRHQETLAFTRRMGGMLQEEASYWWIIMSIIGIRLFYWSILLTKVQKAGPTLLIVVSLDESTCLLLPSNSWLAITGTIQWIFFVLLQLQQKKKACTQCFPGYFFLCLTMKCLLWHLMNLANEKLNGEAF